MRLIENYNTDAITKDFILTNEWDVIKLNKKIDVKELREWYFSVSKNLEHLKFNFRTCTKYIKESVNNKFTIDTNNYQWILKNEYMLLQNSSVMSNKLCISCSTYVWNYCIQSGSLGYLRREGL